MIDFHTHILFDVDDGARTIEDSLTMLKEAMDAGFTHVVLTPHYMEHYYEVSKEEASDKIYELNNLMQENNINLKLYQGNEIYISSNMHNLLENGRASSINGSKYVLIETPMLEKPDNLLEVIYDLKKNGRVPIIAHPERYRFVQNDFDIIYDLIEQGVLFQINIGSLIGVYGTDVKNVVKKMIKEKIVHFIGTDAHSPKSIYLEINKVIKKLEKYASKEYIQEITYSNAMKVLNDMEL